MMIMKKNTNLSISKKWMNISVILFGMFGLSTLSFNCAPALFQAASVAPGTLGSSSLGDVISENPKEIFVEPKSPFVLMTSKQMFQSMLNLTGQFNRKTAAQQTEFLARTQSLPDVSNVASVNAPLQLASTSLAGEVCRKLIDDEKAGTRRIFTGVDFNAGPANQAAGYTASVTNMAIKFWGRSPSRSEASELTTFFQDFTSGVTNNAAETDKLYLATCSAMLASFDAITY